MKPNTAHDSLSSPITNPPGQQKILWSRSPPWWLFGGTFTVSDAQHLDLFNHIQPLCLAVQYIHFLFTKKTGSKNF